MRIGTIAALIAIAALAGLPALGGVAAAAPKTTVKLGDNFFAPSSKTIDAGTKVRFKWVGNRAHNVSKVSGPGRFFESPTTRSRGVNFAKKFSKPGVYRLICTIHPNKMKLKLTVG